MTTEHKPTISRDEPHKEPYTNNEGTPLCWMTGCYRRGIFRDWGGWLWCWRHTWRYAQRPLRRVRIG
jgi:hypothetical protein